MRKGNGNGDGKDKKDSCPFRDGPSEKRCCFCSFERGCLDSVASREQSDWLVLRQREWVKRLASV